MSFAGFNVQRLDRRTKKALDSQLKQALPRRRQEKEQSSYYMALRVKLLPVNPHFKRDVLEIRQLFHLPEGEISDIDLMQFPDKQPPWEKDDTLSAADAAGFWLEVHQNHFLNLKRGDWVPPLPQWLIDSATMRVPSEGSDLAWLRKHPDIPERYAKWFDLNVPMTRLVTVLIREYQLPWFCSLNLERFILTQDKELLKDISPFDVTINRITDPIEAFTVTVDWIDEYTTKKQWDEIYERRIRPLQDSYWERRGDLPHSKQIEPKSLLDQSFIKVYTHMVERGIGVDRALTELSKNERFSAMELDRSMVFKHIKTLDAICKPKRLE